MNNNFKKLLASAMALAMVTSVMPATNVDAATVTVCDAADKEKAELYAITMQDLVDAIEGVTELSEVKLYTEIKWGNETVTVKDVLETVITSDDGEKLVDKLQNVVSCGTSSQKAIAKFFVHLQSSVTEIDQKVASLAGHYAPKGATIDYVNSLGEDSVISADGNWLGRDIEDFKNQSSKDEATSLYEYFADEEGKFASFKGNLSDDVLDLFDTYFGDLETAYTDYKGTTFEGDLDNYVANLLSVEVKDSLTVEDLVKGTTSFKNNFKHNDYKVLNKVIEKITKDKAQNSDGEEIKGYSRFEDADEVVEIMDALEAIATDAKEVDEFIKPINSKKDSTYKALYVDKAKWNGETSEILASYLNAEMEEVKDASTVYARSLAFDKLLNTISTDEMDAVISYVENITNEFYTVAKTKRSTGKYNIKLEETELATYLTDAEQEKVKGLTSLLLAGPDAEEETTYYELLVSKSAEIKEAIEAISTGIKNITINNLNSANASKVVVANDALSVLTNQILTSAQNKVYAKNKKNVEVLYNYMLYNGIVTVEPNGWVDLGNGNWDYYQDGKAFTGWVCSAKDVWYYVSNGHMLRDAWVWRDSESAYYVGNNGKMVYGPTTVKGYELDANGLWHK